MHKYLITVCIIFLNSKIMFSQWEWQNPLPQGNRLGKVQFVDAFHGWIIAGTILLRSVDGGNNWDTEYMGKSPNSIYFTDAFNGWAVGSGNPPFIIRTRDGGKTWETLPLPEEYQNINYLTLFDVFFLDLLKGYFSDGSGHIFYTSDGGYTWEKQIFLMPGRDIKSICFINSSKGWAVGDIPLLQTTDGGNEWSVDSTMLGDVFGLQATKILFTDLLNGWILTKYKSFHTSNGGNDWIEYDVDPDPLGFNSRFGEYIQNDIMFLGSAEGWVSTSWGLYHTINGGETWEVIADEMSFKSVYFLNSQVGFASAEGGIYYDINNEYLKTTDGGLSWEKLTAKYTDATLYSVDFVNAEIGWTVGTYGTIMKTNNGGETWFRQTSGLEANNGLDSWLRDVQFVDLNNGWVVGDGGTILKTTDGGETWLHQISGTTYRLEKCSFINLNEGWIVGGLTILHTVDRGETWEILNEEIGNLYGVYFVDSFSGWVVTGGPATYDRSCIYRTIDGGQAWELQLEKPEFDFRGITFTSKINGIVLGANGILRTSDGGNTWREQGYLPINGIMSACFIDSHYGWACGLEGDVIFTNDGGTTWNLQQSMVYSYPLYDIDFVDTETGWTVGLFGTIIHTSSGGITSAEPQIAPVTVVDNSIELYTNYPNPFNPTTKIKYQLPETGLVKIKVYDILGEEIATLINQSQEAGSYEVEFNAVNLPSGIYIYTISANGFVQSKKMVLTK